MLAEEIRAKLMLIPYSGSRILEHERMKEALFKLGTEKRYIAQEETNVVGGRIDLCWLDFTGKARVAFEIDQAHPKRKSITKLQNLECEHKFIILRKNPLPFDEVGDVILIGLNRKSPYRYSYRKRESSKENPAP